VLRAETLKIVRELTITHPEPGTSVIDDAHLILTFDQPTRRSHLVRRSQRQRTPRTPLREQLGQDREGASW